MLLPVGGVPDARTKLLPSANEPIRYSADVAVAECTEVSCPFRRGVVSSSHDVVPNCVRFHGEVGACPTVCVLLVCPIIIWCMELAHEAPPLSDRQMSRTRKAVVAELTRPVSEVPS